ncbi:MAG: D-glycero-beta-D-manno-heptose 1-phosphate adenylyltransferase [Phycisphaerae bacterium]|nr:D-glycero-beta-D-manno-heptose 1-phosphate adenylyltransferase [Phycisphaerae bacterium]
MDDLRRALTDWKPFDVIVVGDFMLDELVHGDAGRLSADAPVPVLDVASIESRPGGAANLCLDLAAMKGKVTAIGVTGDDIEAKKLRAVLASKGVITTGLVVDESRPTTVKRSLIGLAQGRHPQKMFRVDVESREPIADEIERAVVERLTDALRPNVVVCIEDYGKGVCTERLCQRVIALATEAGAPVLVDPAARVDFGRYRGATAITPNRTEAEHATGLATHEGDDEGMLDHNTKLAHAMLSTLDLDAVVLTLDRHGALLLEREASTAIHVPTVAREVYDVTGAGDMMLAGLAAGLANGMSWRLATELANIAAGLEVEQFGVMPIPIERIHYEVIRNRSQTDPSDRLRTLEEARVEIAATRAVGKRVVFTNGCFDVLHAGHVTLLEKARSLGDHLVVGLNSDASVTRLKGEGRPVTPESDRAKLLAALRSVDTVVLFEDDTPIKLIEALKPDVLVKGADYTRETVVGADVVASYGGRVELVDLVEGRSTTSIIDRVRGA